MARRRPTPWETKNLPVPPDFVKLAKEWCEDESMLILTLVWEGYDRLRECDLLEICWQQDYEERERTITQRFVPRIRQCMTGWEPFDVEHGPYEFETRKAPPAQSPQYDIAFVMHGGDGRMMWPLEAKVLRSEGKLSEYINDINNEFLTCRYAPFSSQGGMLGYLFSTQTSKVCSNIEAKLSCSLEHHPHFLNRIHKISKHHRKVPSGKPYPANFLCHHLILQITTKSL